jgi:TorA maturation chaperone TorD
MEDPLDKAEVLEILHGRAATYNFLSQVYRQEVFQSFLSDLVKELTSDAERDEAESEGHRTLRAFAEGIREIDPANVKTELASEYAALFLNVSQRGVFPYESVYTSPERLLMQRARDEVLAEYRKEGLSRIGEFKEPEDHIAIELEFMAYLCQKTADAVKAGDRAAAVEYLQKQKDFLEKHLLVWVPQFCKDLLESTKSDFYKGIAQITEEHLSLEGDTIAELTEAVQV